MAFSPARAGSPATLHESDDVCRLRIEQHTLEVGMGIALLVTANGVPTCAALAPSASAASTFSWLLKPRRRR